MARNNIEKQIQERIEVFVAELSGLVREAALGAVQEVLGGGAAPRRGRPRTTSKAPARRSAALRKPSKSGKRAKRSGNQVEAVAETILAHVKANAGTGVTDMGAALGMTPKEMRLPILKLLADKKLKTTGQRRGTKYHAGGRGTATKKKASKKRATKKTTKRKAKRGAKKTSKK
jgi:hypothetical protein